MIIDGKSVALIAAGLTAVMGWHWFCMGCGFGRKVN